MNLRNLVTLIERTSKAYPLVQEFGEGDIYEYLNSGEHKYPCVFMTIGNITADTSDTLRIRTSLFYVDRLTSSADNRLNVQSSGVSALKAITEKLSDVNIMTVTSGTYTPFTEKFSDLCAGAFVELSIDLASELDCSDYQLGTLTIKENGLYNILGYENVIVNVGGGKWGEITGNIEDQTDLVEYIEDATPNIEAGRSIYFTQGEGNSIVINAENQTEFTGSNGIVVSANNTISIDTKLIHKDVDDVTYKNYRGEELIYSEQSAVRIPFDKTNTNDGIYWEEGNLYIKSTDKVNIALDGTTVLDINDSDFYLGKSNNDTVIYGDNDNLTMYGPEGRVFQQGDDKIIIFDNDDSPLIECQDENITIYKDGNDWIKTTSDGEYIHYLDGNEVLRWDNNHFIINNENGDGFISNDHTDGDNWRYWTNIYNYGDDLLNSGRIHNRYDNHYYTTLSNNGNDIIYAHRSEGDASDQYGTTIGNGGNDVLYAQRTYNKTGGFESGNNGFYNSNGDTIIDAYHNGQSNVYNTIVANGYDTFANSYYDTDNEIGWTSLKFPNGDDCIDLMKNGNDEIISIANGYDTFVNSFYNTDNETGRTSLKFPNGDDCIDLTKNGNDEIISITIGGTTLDLDEAKLQKLKELLED